MYDELISRADFFHPWHCISLHLQHQTIDLIVKNKEHLYCLIHRLLEYFKTPELLRSYKIARFRMLLSFEAWRKSTTILNLFKSAFKQTLKQKQYLYSN
jgi:hypothetical protein